jgi:hypothetical protein
MPGIEAEKPSDVRVEGLVRKAESRRNVLGTVALAGAAALAGLTPGVVAAERIESP